MLKLKRMRLSFLTFYCCHGVQIAFPGQSINGKSFFVVVCLFLIAHNSNFLERFNFENFLSDWFKNNIKASTEI